MAQDKAASGARATIGVAPMFDEITEDILFGDIWERAELSKRDRSLVTCAALVATGKTEQMNVGARVGVGTMVDSCRHCAECVRGWENYCENGNTQTYASTDRDGSSREAGTRSSSSSTRILCSGSRRRSTWQKPARCSAPVSRPTRRFVTGAWRREKSVAILGLGGLGHIAVQLAAAIGAEVTVITTSPGLRCEGGARQRIGLSEAQASVRLHSRYHSVSARARWSASASRLAYARSAGTCAVTLRELPHEGSAHDVNATYIMQRGEYHAPMRFLTCVALLVVVACGSSPKPDAVTLLKPSMVPPRPAPAKPVALAFVLEGHEMWIGNDQTDVSEDEHYPGALKPLEEAFAHLSTANLPTGSTATVVTYGEHASVRHAMAPVATLTAAVFGEQKDYRGIIDRDLVAGVTLGLDELAKITGSRRVLVVIGDGTDTNADTAKAALTTLAKRAAAEDVQVVSFVYKGMLSSPATPIAGFDPKLLTVNSIDEIESDLETLFEGFTPKPMVARSGNAVAVVLLVSGAEIWMGNDDIEPATDPSRYLGALKAIRAALDQTPMAGFPAGSQGAILTYEDRVETRLRMGPIEKIDARAIGDQKTYYRTVGNELASGVRAAIGQLANVETGGRKVLIILGDGNDTNNEAAKAQLRDLAKKASELHIEVRALIWKSALSDEDNVIRELDPTVSIAKTSDELTTQLTAVLRVLR